MSLRYLAGYITESYNPLKVPNAPTITSVTPADTQLTVAFTAPANVGGGAITSYIAVATKTSDGTAVSATGSASSIIITGLTNNSAYTVQVCAVNAFGPGPYSSPSGNVTPVAQKLYSWGANNQGQIGDSTTVNRSSPIQIGALTNWQSISSGLLFSASIKTNGTLWTWGYNNSGQLGLNNALSASSPIQVGALTNWAKISAGKEFAAAIKTDGTLWAWGDNFYGQLGQNNRTNYSSPIQVGALTNWADVSSAPFVDSFIVAIKTDGTLWSWGQNNYGDLGQNDITYRSSPVQIGALNNWKSIKCGSEQTIAIKTDGTLWAWGRGLYGCLGNNSVINRSSPVQIGSLTTWSLTAAGYLFSAAIKTDGTLWTWGVNNKGQLGLNLTHTATGYRSSPTQVGTETTWGTAYAGKNCMLSIKTNGTLWAWGENDAGQLGQNDLVNRSSPVQVGSGTTWLKISAGGYFSMATQS